ncbi:MAG: hypothetical protein GY755_18715 [Chloroflexi bacterium]|nr:hypothetical protein [Chloroflexota bacterium]
MKHLTESQLNEYLDQMLDYETQQRVETHLASCESCRLEITELQALFISLNELPEIPIAHDLTLGVLAQISKVAKIPLLWKQPIFLAQSIFTFILLLFSMPILSSFWLQIEKWSGEITFPTIQTPSLAQMVSQFMSLLAWEPETFFFIPELSFSVPTLPTLPISPNSNLMLLLALSAGIMWGIGNYSLLRSKPEVRE